MRFVMLCTAVGLALILPQDRGKRAGTEAQVRTTPTSKTAAGAGRKRTDSAANRPELTKARQAAALEFADAHHPELARLIRESRKKKPSEYNRAIRELHAARERLTKLQARSPERYATSLSEWKLTSHIRMELARWARSPNAELAARIRKLLSERQSVRKHQYERERDRLRERLSRVESLLTGVSADDAVDKEWQRLSKSVNRRRAARRRKSKKSKPKADKDEPVTDKKKPRKNKPQ